jgi:hypothetical protein
MKGGLNPRGHVMASIRGESISIGDWMRRKLIVAARKHHGTEVSRRLLFRQMTHIPSVMRALTQFITSRSHSYGKAYVSHDAEVRMQYILVIFSSDTAQFRSVVGLHHWQGYEPHMRGNAPKQKDGKWIVPSEDQEGSGFIRDMVGTLTAYWTKVMGDAHGRM